METDHFLDWNLFTTFSLRDCYIGRYIVRTKTFRRWIIGRGKSKAYLCKYCYTDIRGSANVSWWSVLTVAKRFILYVYTTSEKSHSNQLRTRNIEKKVTVFIILFAKLKKKVRQPWQVHTCKIAEKFSLFESKSKKENKYMYIYYKYSADPHNCSY